MVAIRRFQITLKSFKNSKGAILSADLYFGDTTDHSERDRHSSGEKYIKYQRLCLLIPTNGSSIYIVI